MTPPRRSNVWRTTFASTSNRAAVELQRLTISSALASHSRAVRIGDNGCHLAAPSACAQDIKIRFAHSLSTSEPAHLAAALGIALLDDHRALSDSRGSDGPRYEVRNKGVSNGFKQFYCVHGHIHQRRVLTEDGLPDPLYINVSVEQIGYTPVNLEELFK